MAGGTLKATGRRAIAAGLLLLLLGAAPPLTVADPGAIGDAGGSPSQATPLAAEGSYNGTISTADNDWYRLDIDDDRTVCLRVLVSGDIASHVTLSPSVDLEPSVTRQMEAGKVLDLAMAVEPTDTAFVGLEAANLLDSGDYTFEIQAFTLSELPWQETDTGDAGDDPSQATPLPRICQPGHLSPRSQDTADVYSFQIGEDKHLGLSLVQVGDTPLELALISPAGEVVEAVTNGSFEDVTIEEAGTWYLSFQTSSSSSDDWIGYIGGITINGPEPPPCRPGCLE